MKEEPETKPGKESEVMSLLERIIYHAEQAQSVIQDDSKITNKTDEEVIKEACLRIRALTVEIDHIIRPPNHGY